jgi:RimJ/RimL family protein N-acetyltransferase
VIEKDTGLWVGRVGPWMPEGWPGTEVGWGLHPRAWGKGYAVEAAEAAIDFAVDELGWTRIVHCIDPDNEGSRKVAERVGSRFLETGRLPEPYHETPVQLWGQSADDWRARRGQGASYGVSNGRA